MGKIEKITTFEDLNKELNDFYTYLKDNNFKDEEIRKIFEPVIKHADRSYRRIKIFACVLTTFLLVYALTYFETVEWNLSAVGRILLIKALPLFDWRYLKGEPCLLKKWWAPMAPSASEFNCDLCENIKKVDAYTGLDPDRLQDFYLDLNIPIVMGNSLDNWPEFENFSKQLISDEVMKGFTPCYQAFNFLPKMSSIGTVLEKSQLVNSFFFHFQNCDIMAVKHFRLLIPRPQFLPPEISPIQYSWVLWSKRYKFSRPKLINLKTPYTVIGQMKGNFLYHLIPNGNCKEVCPVLDIKLNAGEALMITSLWDLEYTSEDSSGENVAIVLEA